MDRKTAVLEKLSHYVAANYGGDYKAAFDGRDRDHDGVIRSAELIDLLADAGVGSVFTRPAWAYEVIRLLDLDSDRGISWSEFEAAVRGS